MAKVRSMRPHRPTVRPCVGSPQVANSCKRIKRTLWRVLHLIQRYKRRVRLGALEFTWTQNGVSYKHRLAGPIDLSKEAQAVAEGLRANTNNEATPSPAPPEAADDVRTSGTGAGSTGAVQP